MKATLAGHPLHPQLIGFPVAMFPASLVFDILRLATGDKSYADAAYRSMLAGYIGGAAAAGAGAVDYLAIPSGSQAKRVANLHLLLNLGIMSLYGLNLAMRRGRQRREPGGLPLALSVIGSAVLFISGWLGGHLVYHHGMRVKGVSPIEASPDLKVPGDEAIERFLGGLVESPATTPTESETREYPRAA